MSLPETACTPASALFLDGLESIPRLPVDDSAGSGGASGAFAASTHVAGIGNGTQTWYGYAPALTLQRPLPLVLLLHGGAGSPAAADTAAMQLRDQWQPLAAARGFLLVVPVAGGNAGGWLAPSGPGDHPSDYDVISAALADAESMYRVNRTRRYGWGFSAGGHVMHDLAINGFAPTFSEPNMAAYAVSAGLLPALACSGMTSAQCDALLSAVPRPLPVLIRIGSSDAYQPYAAADRNRFLANGWTSDSSLGYSVFSGGHVIDAGEPAASWSFLCRFATIP
ncbi:MAG: hypothetical protein KDI75_03375 [Xanthomonadales bacterium]|nr:hypothetical protein [Xanthomonadales bacterium]